MKVLILAGGFATRLWPLTEHRAKPLLLLDGQTILTHILEKVPADLEVILLTNKRFEADFQKELEKLGRKNVEIFCEDAHSDQEKLGAVGALSMAIKYFSIDENLVVIAGDNLLPELHIDQLFCSEKEGKVAVREVEDLYEARKFGVVEISDFGMRNAELKNQNRKDFLIKRFEEKPENPKSNLVSTGFFGIGKDLLPILHSFAQKEADSLGGVFTEFLAHGKKLSAVKVGGEWFDVGSFETYLEAHRKLQKEDLKLAQSSKLKTSSFAKATADRQNQGNKFSGKVFIGEDSEIQNCRIQDSIIYPNVKLKNCIISQSVIDEGCDFEGLDLNRKLVRRGTRLHESEQ